MPLKEYSLEFLIVWIYVWSGYPDPQGNLLQLSFILSNAALGINSLRIRSVILREPVNSMKWIVRFPMFLKWCVLEEVRSSDLTNDKGGPRENDSSGITKTIWSRHHIDPILPLLQLFYIYGAVLLIYCSVSYQPDSPTWGGTCCYM